jgi:urease accessory protein
MWRLLQLADSAFPAGGFAHSAGLEAALRLGELASLEAFVRQTIWQAAHGPLVLLRGAWSGGLGVWDRRAEVFLTSHVANRASRAQGRAFAAAAARAFPETSAIDGAIRAGEARGHQAPVTGAVARALGLGEEEAQAVFLHSVVRGVLSAAVRLGRIGPLEAQNLQGRLAASCEEALAASRQVAEPTQTAPLLELVGARHDELYSRLFQS